MADAGGMMEAKRRTPELHPQALPFLDKQRIAPQPKTILDSILTPEYRRGMNRDRLQRLPYITG